MPEMTVVRNFSRAARDYDANARVQAAVARELLSYSGCGAPKTILEPGCGTGLYTRMLLDSFPEAELEAIDISDAMVCVARERVGSHRASFLCIDAETLSEGRYDLITSNATFHWFRDLARTVESFHGMLDSGGTLTFSYFGPGTYRELQDSLGHTISSSAGVACNRFLGPVEVRSLLESTFRESAVEEREYKETFDSLRDLLDNIKSTGTRGAGGCLGVAWSRGLLRDLEQVYLERFGGIHATYQVYMCRAEK